MTGLDIRSPTNMEHLLVCFYSRDATIVYKIDFSCK
jgi:hypothetical protein